MVIINPRCSLRREENANNMDYSDRSVQRKVGRERDNGFYRIASNVFDTGLDYSHLEKKRVSYSMISGETKSYSALSYLSGNSSTTSKHYGSGKSSGDSSK